MLRYDDALDLAASYGLVAVDDDRSGPLPWLPTIPQQLADNPTWGAYLRERGELVTSVADEVALAALTDPPTWADGLPPRLTTDVAVWRAAYGIPDNDLRPTGARVDGYGWDHQRRLERQIVEPLGTTTSADWTAQLPVAVLEDLGAGRLRRRLEGLRQGRPDVPDLIQQALDNPRQLPVENPADALWWRVVAADASTPQPKPKPTHALPREPERISHHQDYPYSRRPDRSPGIGR